VLKFDNFFIQKLLNAKAKPVTCKNYLNGKAKAEIMNPTAYYLSHRI